ncbi:MAG: glycosyltransferase family 4 protein [Pirellulales bacterium]|nr:glycosyltransferase family 4 protein [Pirellulales bacterium]
MGASTCFFTIASKNYLSHVRTLMASVAEHHPDAARCLVLCDRVEGRFAPETEPFAVLPVEALDISGFEELAFKYNCMELNTAVKPFAIEHLFAERGFRNVVYLDPDIVLYRPLRKALDRLQRHDAVLTPHLTDFLPDDGCLPDNVRILQTGTNNLGFLALRKSERVMQLLRWWKAQLRERCVHAIHEGLFVDQKWMDLALSCVESACLLRHPGYNVAYWNLPHRRITRDARGRYRAGGRPLVFFHFSGFEPGDLAVVSKHQTRLSWSDLGSAGRRLFRDYRRRLYQNGFQQVRQWPYAYRCFENGVEIPECLRAYYRRHLAGKLPPATSLFGVSGDQATLYGLFQSPVKKEFLTAAALALYEFYPDLQRAFPQVPGKDSRRLAEWLSRLEPGDPRMSEPFLESVRQIVAAMRAGDSALAKRHPAGVLGRCRSRLARKILQLAGRRRSLVNMVPPQWRHRLGGLLKRQAFADPYPSLEESAPSVPLYYAPSDLGINVFGMLEHPTGVGEAARSMAACFEHLQLPARRISFDERHLFFNQPLPAASQPDPRFPINYCHVNADCTGALRHLFGGKTFADRFNIGFWAWELEHFPERWDAAFNLYDEIWVPSAFAQQAVAARARIPVVCIPHAIRSGPRPCDGRRTWGIPDGRPAVLCMFDAASVGERKNPVASIRAVKAACAGRHHPLLVLKVGRPDVQEGLLPQLQAEAEGLDCLIIDQWLSREQTRQLIAACDVLVSLHRSEGFGLILAEAMALGKPVVATRYSGNADFMNSANSCPVDYELIRLERDVGPYPAGARWAEPDVGHAARLIRELLEDPGRREALGRKAAEDIARDFSVEAVSQRIRSRIERLGFTAGWPAAEEPVAPPEPLAFPHQSSPPPRLKEVA